jgi:HTH-type transcriptional regulator, quorum sensing regulator NprR
LAEMYLDKKDNHKAYEILNDAYEIVSVHYAPSIIRASILINLGIVHGKLGEYHTAIRLLEEVKSTNKNTGRYFKTGEILISLGICYRRISKEALAENCYKEALNFFDFFNDDKLRGTAYFNLGILKSHQKEYEKSVEYLLLALNTYKQLNEDDNLFQTKIALAKAFMKMSKMNQSQQYCFQVIAAADKVIYKINSYLILGDSFYNQDDYTNALSYFQEALDLIELSNEENQQKKQEVLIRIGHCYYKLGNFKDCGLYYHKALNE